MSGRREYAGTTNQDLLRDLLMQRQVTASVTHSRKFWVLLGILSPRTTHRRLM
jgi:hypothetical protein